MAKPYVRLDKDNAAVLLVDHQTGLLSLVRDIDQINSKIMYWRLRQQQNISIYRPF